MPRPGTGYHTKASKLRPLYATARPAGAEPALESVPRFKRKCLKCDKGFLGVGMFNRLCFYCNIMNAAIAGRGE